MTTTPPHRLPLPDSWHRLGPRIDAPAQSMGSSAGCDSGRRRSRWPGRAEPSAWLVASGPVDTLAHMLISALNEAAMLIGWSANPNTTPSDAMRAFDRILAGTAGKPQPPGNSAR